MIQTIKLDTVEELIKFFEQESDESIDHTRTRKANTVLYILKAMIEDAKLANLVLDEYPITEVKATGMEQVIAYLRYYIK